MRCGWLWLLVFNLAPGGLTPAYAGTLSYDAPQATLTANASQLPLRELLEDLATQTGWKIYVDPALEHTVSSRFHRLPATEALQRLLRGLNFSLSPSAESPPELHVYTGSASSATLLVNPAPLEERDLLPDEWVIRLKPDAVESIEQIARRHGATVVGKVEGSEIYRLRFENAEAADRARQSLEADPQIDGIEHNYVARPPHQTAATGQSLLPPLALTPKPLHPAEGLIVALLDTAVATDAPVLKDFLLPAVVVTETMGSNPESLTHGTAMAETLLRSLAMHSAEPGASTVRILPVDIYGDQPTTTTFDIVNGLLVAARSGARVINLSLGGEGASPLLSETVRTLSHSGVLVIAAAGNTPTAARVFPAAYPEVLAVTAADSHGNVAPYANYGDFVDLLGPGTSMVQHENRVYLGTGTSYATAHISGAAAAFLSTAGSTPTAVDHALRQSYGYRAPILIP